VKRAIEAMNDFYGTQWREGNKYVSLEDVQSANESARIRNVGITIETRPDWTEVEHIDAILGLGATKVEIGVQSTYDFILAGIRRGHTVKQSVEANTRLRDSGLKVGFHMMPGLPGCTNESDLAMFRTLFEDERFKPDYLKIYPTLVTEGTQLHGMWELGNYEPLEVEEAVEMFRKGQIHSAKVGAPSEDTARYPCVSGACRNKEKRYKGISQTAASGNGRQVQLHQMP